MAKRKRKRGTRRKNMSGAALLSAPRRRRRNRSVMAAPRRRKRRRGLSEMNLVKGKAGTYLNPILEGAAGGVATQLMVKAVPEKIFTDNPSLVPYKNWIKGGILLVGAAFAAHMKQPLLAAGMAGGAAILTMQEEGILQEGMSAPRRRLRPARFANPGLLSRRGMSDRRLLSEGSRQIYSPYQGQAMYDYNEREVYY